MSKSVGAIGSRPCIAVGQASQSEVPKSQAGKPDLLEDPIVSPCGGLFKSKTNTQRGALTIICGVSSAAPATDLLARRVWDSGPAGPF